MEQENCNRLEEFRQLRKDIRRRIESLFFQVLLRIDGRV
jgi:hypothetical protein